MVRQAQVEIDDMEQFRCDSVALRRKLGISGGRLTEEQQRIYLDAQREMWLAKHPNAMCGGPPRPKPKE